MDSAKLINIVKEYPEVWDRNSTAFRERDHKEIAWDKIGRHMNYSAQTCKDTFKSLREKYIREREKQAMFGEKYTPWAHLDSLSFLDPHILPRKQQVSFDAPLKINGEAQFFNMDGNHGDFDKALIELVKKASPIWDRKSNGYPSKQLKFQLWKNISQTLNKDLNICMQRWKGLREKYIRQRTKYQEGDGKWEFLDEMSFLDTVIQYRRKQNETLDRIKKYEMLDSQYSTSGSAPSTDHYLDDDSSFNDSSSATIIKSEDVSYDLTIHENSYDSGMMSAGRKRSASDNSESSTNEKRERVEESSKTPEQVFGDLVATMLAKKTEREKNIAMIDIMKILTK